jgi:catechol 2,3-dioxygenase-like lactoylglutathione lyase family enzyme
MGGLERSTALAPAPLRPYPVEVTDEWTITHRRRHTMLQKSPMYAYIPAKDVTRARRFYENTLGFRPKEEIAGGVAYEFAAGTSCFLYPTPNAGTSAASQAFWQVDDVEREVAELKAKGVKFEEYDLPGMKDGIVREEGAKAAWFKDTEGNIMAIIEGP